MSKLQKYCGSIILILPFIYFVCDLTIKKFGLGHLLFWASFVSFMLGVIFMFMIYLAPSKR